MVSVNMYTSYLIQLSMRMAYYEDGIFWRKAKNKNNPGLLWSWIEVKIRDEIFLKEPYSQPIKMVDGDLLMMNIRSKKGKEGKLLNLKRQSYGYEKCQGISSVMLKWLLVLHVHGGFIYWGGEGGIIFDIRRKWP